MFDIRKKIARTAKNAGLLIGGLLLCSVGIGFLTVAAWLGLSALIGAQLTAVTIASVYIGVGLIMIGITASKPLEKEPTSPPPKSETPDTPPIIEAFLYGLKAGSKT